MSSLRGVREWTANTVEAATHVHTAAACLHRPCCPHEATYPTGYCLMTYRWAPRFRNCSAPLELIARQKESTQARRNRHAASLPSQGARFFKQSSLRAGDVRAVADTVPIFRRGVARRKRLLHMQMAGLAHTASMRRPNPTTYASSSQSMYHISGWEPSEMCQMRFMRMSYATASPCRAAVQPQPHASPRTVYRNPTR